MVDVVFFVLMSSLRVETVAIIGSFRQQYSEVLESWHTFNAAGLRITSPKGTPIVTPGEDFVRFESDDPAYSNAQIQQIALHRILGAHFVLAVTPDGYVGRTTCYEIGRIVDRNKPLYFSEMPKDLPLEIPRDHIGSAAALVERFRSEMPKPILESLTGVSFELEQNLAHGNYLAL